MEKQEDKGENDRIDEVHVLEGARVAIDDGAHSIGLDAEERRLNGDR